MGMYRHCEYNVSRGRFATREMRRRKPVPTPVPRLSDRAAGALIGLAAGRLRARGPGPDGSLALMRILAEELAAGRHDLRTLAHRWVAQHAAAPQAIDPETGAALAHLARHDAPPSRAAGEGSDPLVRSIPVALAACDTPRTLVSATYHIVALTHPEPLVAWSAVAVNLALACFIRGQRDFVADVIEAMRANEVPDILLTAVRRVPLPPRAMPVDAAAVPGGALVDAEAALRLAYHEPLLVRGLDELAATGPAAAGRAGLAGALLGARDGADALPLDWTSSVERDLLGAVAARLVRTTPAAT
jgi:ADP-ribosyl-[dinitrogen reductase] hydrolase